jgi:hypothetical protein
MARMPAHLIFWRLGKKESLASSYGENITYFHFSAFLFAYLAKKPYLCGGVIKQHYYE